jgi:hypothetical protein
MFYDSNTMLTPTFLQSLTKLATQTNKTGRMKGIDAI